MEPHVILYFFHLISPLLGISILGNIHLLRHCQSMSLELSKGSGSYPHKTESLILVCLSI